MSVVRKKGTLRGRFLPDLKTFNDFPLPNRTKKPQLQKLVFTIFTASELFQMAAVVQMQDAGTWFKLVLQKQNNFFHVSEKCLLQVWLDPDAQVILSGFSLRTFAFVIPSAGWLNPRSSHGWLLVIQVVAEMSPLWPDLLGHQLKQDLPIPGTFCFISLALLDIHNFLKISCGFLSFLFILGPDCPQGIWALQEQGLHLPGSQLNLQCLDQCMVDTDGVFIEWMDGSINAWIPYLPSLSFALSWGWDPQHY